MHLVAPIEIGIACCRIDLLTAFYMSACSFTLVSRISVPAALSAQTPLGSQGYTVVRLQSRFGERLKLLSPTSNQPGCRQQRPASNIIDGANTTFLTFIVDDLAAARSRAIGLGATALGEAVQIRPDLCIAFLCDPEGNYIELAEYHDVRDYRPDL